MPPPLAIDKEQVRMLVLSVGVREAARQLDLNQETVAAWSARGDWLAHTREKPVLPKSMQPIASGASIKPADALTEILTTEAKETRQFLSKTAHKAAKRASEQTGNEIIASSDKVLNIGKLAALTHGWNKDDAGGSRINVNLLCQNVGNLQITADQ